MSFAPRVLADLLNRRPESAGVVVEVTVDTVRVATRTGAVTAVAASPRLAPGDSVTLTAGRAIRAPGAVARYPV